MHELEGLIKQLAEQEDISYEAATRLVINLIQIRHANLPKRNTPPSEDGSNYLEG